MSFFYSRKVLLINLTDEPMHFIAAKKAIRLLLKNKAEVISFWPDLYIETINTKFSFPSIIKMKYYVKARRKNIRYSKYAVFYRDQFTCQYCGIRTNKNNITLEHILPKSLGGISSFENCITSCNLCNRRKANKSLGESGMSLMTIPKIPKTYIYNIFPTDIWFDGWEKFLFEGGGFKQMNPII